MSVIERNNKTGFCINCGRTGLHPQAEMCDKCDRVENGIFVECKFDQCKNLLSPAEAESEDEYCSQKCTQKIKNKTQLLFTPQKKCDLTGKIDRPYIRIYKNFDVSIKGLDELLRLISKLRKGQKEKKNNIEISLDYHSCHFCLEETGCLKFNRLEGKKLPLRVCKRCLLKMKDYCKKESEKLVYSSRFISVVKSLQAPRYDAVEDEVVNFDNAIIVGGVGLKTKMKNIKKLKEILKNPKKYDFVSTKKGLSKCGMCGDIKKGASYMVVNHYLKNNDFICPECEKKLWKSLDNYIEKNSFQLVSLIV